MESLMWAARLVGAAALALPVAGLELAGPAARPPAPGAAEITSTLSPDRIAGMMRSAGMIRSTAGAPPAVLSLASVSPSVPAAPHALAGSRPAARPHPAARPRPSVHPRAVARSRPGTEAGQGPSLAVRPAVIRQAAVLAAARPAAVIGSDGALRSKAGLPAPPMTSAMLWANSLKQAQARRFVTWLRHRRVTPDANCTTKACLSGLPVARSLAATQQPQVRNYWCGPATVSEMLRQIGPKVNQAAAAKQLGTTGGGTDWSNQHGYPVPQVLNQNQARNSYVAVGLPWSPTSQQVQTYQRDLLADINKGAGVPLAGNAYEVPGGPHLVGHPPGQTIAHWFDIRGYAQSGKITQYEDSVHGASSIGWAASVPAYSSLPSQTIVYILGARGYDW